MCNLPLFLVFALSLLPLAIAQAAPADLPETGQISCFATDGITTGTTPCGSGQDGDHKAGVAWPNPRFAVGGGAAVDCVTDTLTGLMWTRNADLLAAGGNGLRTWQTALDFANGLNLCGFNDWRLPNVNELKSLVNSELDNPVSVLNILGFSNVQPYLYWSSSSYARIPAFAWVVSLYNGSVSADAKTATNHVWPVRAGR